MPRRAVRCSKRVRAALGIGGGRGLCASACVCVCVRERVCHSAPGSACRAVCDTRAHTALCTLRSTPEASVIAMAGCLHPSTPPPCPSHAWRCQATLVQEASVTKILVRVTHSLTHSLTHSSARRGEARLAGYRACLRRLVREWGGAGRRRPPQLGQQAWRLAHTPGRRHGGQASASEPSASIRTPSVAPSSDGLPAARVRARPFEVRRMYAPQVRRASPGGGPTAAIAAPCTARGCS